MPFIVQCPYCKVRSRVPDRALGESGKCSRCANFFTLTPAENQKEPELIGATAGPSDPSSSDLEPGTGSSALPAAIADANAAIERAVEADADIGADDTPADEKPKETKPGAVIGPPAPNQTGSAFPPWINGAGAAAFILGNFALAAASFDSARFMTIPLSMAGLAVVGIALLRKRRKRRAKDYLWLVAGGAVSAMVLATALWRPHVLNRQWGRDFDVPQTDPTQMLLVSRDNRVTGSPLKETDWVDASKYAIRQGDVHVALEKVVLAVPAGKGPAKDKQVGLLVTMRLGNVGPLQQIVYERAKGEPTLRDDRGKAYAMRAFGPSTDVNTRPDKELVGPNRRLEDLLIWEAPDAGVTFLELTMAAAAWGGKGAFKFRIPSDMYVAKKDAKKG